MKSPAKCQDYGGEGARWALLQIMLAMVMPLAARAGATPMLHTFPTITADDTGATLQSAMIWTDPPLENQGAAVAFRKRFDLAVKPTTATLSVFADARYVLWVNGAYVDRGPSRFQPNGPQYDVIEMAGRLHAGKNVLSLLVVGNLSGGKVMRHAPALTALMESDGKALFRSDATWRWSDHTRFRKIDATWANLSDAVVDARVEDGDWTQPDYNDAAWKSASAVSGNGWGALTRSPMPPLRETAVEHHLKNGATLPVTLTAGEKLEFDTTRIVQAYPLIGFDADAGTELSLEPFHVKYTARAGPQSHFTIDSHGLSQGTILVKSGRATLTQFKLIERLYPYDRAGSFRCNDDLLNKLWTTCARSCEVLSEDSYVDCADRERVEWMDDDPPGFNITRTAMTGPGIDGKPVFSDPRLLGQMVRRTALTLQPEGWVKAHTCSDRYDIHAKMEDRACEWVAGLRRYYEATGDKKMVQSVWPAVVAQMDYFLARRTSRGLVRARDWVVWGNPVGYLVGETTTLNVFVQRALVDASFLGGVISESADSVRFASAGDELAKAVNSVLWDEKSGGYFSGRFEDADLAENAKAKHTLSLPITDHLTPATLHANVFALDRGVVPPDRRQRVIDAMLEEQKTLAKSAHLMIYYYTMLQLYGLDQPEHDRRVLELFRERWAPMASAPWECSWEAFDGGSKAHIYGMFPGYLLSSYVLGVRWADGVPLNRKLLIEPHLGDLIDAEGTVVTEAGLVTVSWKRTAAGGLEFRVVIPAGVSCELSVPVGPAGKYRLTPAAAEGALHGSRYQFTLSPGAYSGAAD